MIRNLRVAVQQMRTISVSIGGYRSFSAEIKALPKLKAVMEKYRQDNFTQTIPPRFKKEIVAAADKNKDGMISVQEIKSLLDNIGASEKLTDEELEHCMKEAGVENDTKEIPIAQFIRIL